MTVNELGVWVKMKTVDVAIVWDAIAATMANDVHAIAIPAEQNVVSNVVLARLKNSQSPDAAQRFLSFVAGTEGQSILQNCGYCVAIPGQLRVYDEQYESPHD